MFAWSNNVLREEGGHAALEFAFLIPMLLLILAVVLDLGRDLYSATAIEKGLRSAAIFAAQGDYPLTPATRNAATNLAKTGSPSGRAPDLVDGWSAEDATQQSVNRTYTVEETNCAIVQQEARVPYRTMLDGLI